MEVGTPGVGTYVALLRYVGLSIRRVARDAGVLSYKGLKFLVLTDTRSRTVVCAAERRNCGRSDALGVFANWCRRVVTGVAVRLSTKQAKQGKLLITLFASGI